MINDVEYDLFKQYQDEPCQVCEDRQPKDVKPLSDGYEVICEACGAVVDEWHEIEHPRHPSYF